MSDPLHWLAEHAARREQAGLRRVLRPRGAHEPLLDLAGNDYLGLARHPRVIAAAADAVRTWGAGSTGSRLVTGSTVLHEQLETSLSAFVGTESALVFSSGYLANVGAVTALSGDGDLVVSDQHVHASLVDACRLSRARVQVVPHRDVEGVEAALAAGGWRRALVVTDSVFSVDGELAPLADLHQVCRRYGAVLVADEAHALGVVGGAGRGAAAATGLAGEPDVILTATLSKALGSQGGVVLGSAAVIAHLVDTARTFIFDTGLTPAAAGAAAAALDVLGDRPDLPAAVRQHATALAGVTRGAGLETPTPEAAVVGARVGTPEHAVALGMALREHGVRVGVFRPPSVPDTASRLRLTARADLTEADVAQVRDAFAAAMDGG